MAKEEQNLKKKVAGSLAWKLMELAGTQGVQFVVAIILARLMSPQEYGTIALIMIWITIANVIIQSGFATALIQKKDVTGIDYSSVFVVSMILSCIVYVILFISAGPIASIYKTDILVPLLRTVGLVMFPGAIISIQTAYISREMNFKKLFYSTMVAVVLSGTIAIILAYMGYGVWAMAMQQLIYYPVLMVSLLVTVKWRPSLRLSITRLRELLDFGWKMLVSGLIDTVWTNIYGLVIGRRYSTTDLGIYNRGEQFPKLIAANLSSAIQSVMLPAYSKKQDNISELKQMMKQSIRISALAVFPMMAGLMAIARPLVMLVLTDKWLACVPYLRIMCLGYALWPMHITNLQGMNALGRSDMFLKLEIIKKLIGIAILIYSIRYGIAVMLILKVIDEVICTVINAWPNKKLVGYGVLEQYLDMTPAAICAVIMGICTYAIEYIGLSDIYTLLIQIVVGVVIYGVVSALINKKSMDYIIALIKNLGDGAQHE